MPATEGCIRVILGMAGDSEMGALQTDLQSQVIELSAESFKAFCDEMSGTFEIEMGARQRAIRAETPKSLRNRFNKLVAVISVKAEGALSGTFHVIFDQEAFFTLAGVIVMLPEEKILHVRDHGSESDAETMRDPVTETGNLLVGSWDRVFRKGLDGHGHFVQSATFIGKPWSKPEEAIGLGSGEEFTFVGYEVTIAPYPAFHCGVIFPQSLLGPPSELPAVEASAEGEPQDESAAERVSSLQEQPHVSAEPEPQQQADEGTQAEQSSSERSVESENADGKEPQVSEPADEASVEADTTGAVAADESDSAGDSGPAEAEPQAQEALDQQEADTEGESKSASEDDGDNANMQAPDGAVVEQAVEEDVSEAEPEQSPAGPISETIEKMAESALDSSGETEPLMVTSDSGAYLSLSAEQIMDKDVVWGGGEETVQQVLSKMQQHDTGHVLIGTDGALEGIVSRSDIAGAVSVYLRPVFAKWRRPADDATLDIKIKWVMSRPVRTVNPETSLAVILENMRRFGGGCLPVVGRQGKVEGIVTVFGIFEALLRSDSDPLGR